MKVESDDTVEGDPHHPATVLIIDAGEMLSHAIILDAALKDRRELLCTGRPVAIFGHVNGTFFGPRPTHVATELRLLPAVH